MTGPNQQTSATRSRARTGGFDNRANVFWRPGQGEGLLDPMFAE
jgi:hypothetical protein